MDRCSILIWVGLVLVVTGAIFSFSWSSIFKHILQKELQLSPTSKSYALWKDTPVPITMDIYFFNWTNPDELLEENFKPNLVELGPYRFRETHEKVNMTWNANHTITYRQIKRWYFDPEYSNGTLKDNITTLNVVALSASSVSRYRTGFIQMSLSAALGMTRQKVWVTKTTGELLFDGYSDAILTMAASLPNLAQAKIPADKFGLFYTRNGSADFEGVYNMETGEEDISRVGLLRRWNYNNRTDFFEAECGQLNGSSGEIFAPGQTRNKPLEMFSADLCRSITFEYAEDVEVHGVTGYRFILGEKLVDNGTIDSGNWCNCGGQCIPHGALNMSTCRHGAPAFVSYPHYLDADPYYTNHIRGMNPDPNRHRFYLTLEPTTGIPLDVAARLQINLLLQPNSQIALYNDVPTIFFPMMWFEERASVTPQLAANLRLLLMLPVMGLYCSLGLVFVGFVIMALALVPKFLKSDRWTLPQRSERKMAIFNVSNAEEDLLRNLNEENWEASIKLLKNKNAQDINQEYGDPIYKTILAIASEKGLANCVEALLKKGAKPNLFCRIRYGNAPLHFAAKGGNLDAIKVLVKQPDTEVNAVNERGETALHILAQNLKAISKQGETAVHILAQNLKKKEEVEECFLYLACLPRMSVTHRSRKDCSAISEVVGICSKDTLLEVLKKRHDLRPEDRKLILDTHPELKGKVKDPDPDSPEPEYTHDEAYADLRIKSFDKFKDNFNKEFFNRTDLIETTFLQLACKINYIEGVKFLLDSGADVNQTGKHECKPPVYIACNEGHYEILRHLLDTGKVNPKVVEGKTLLHVVLERFSADRKNERNYWACFDYLLKKNGTLNIPINHADNYGHTALHYAVQKNDVSFAKALLDHGAYIGSLNKFSISPLNDIEPETLEAALDNCIKCSENDENKYNLTFNFRILQPVARRDGSGQSNNVEIGQESQERFLPEMFPLYYISQSYKLRHLLKHPILLIFLILKWRRVCIIFYINMFFYLTFVTFLTMDILDIISGSKCGKCGGGENRSYSECSGWEMSSVRIVLCVLFVALFLREIMQLYMLPEKWSYFFNLENCLEVGIIITTAIILSGDCSKLLAAVALILAWTEVILQIGCIHTLAIHNEMIKKVTLNYMKFLLSYSPLIIAFTLSFYKLYHNGPFSEEQDSQHNMCGNFSVHENFYRNYSMSLVKTVVMMIGEFDASSMTFNNGGYFVFLFFVFMMTVVLMNLLNGLAVSDTQSIRDNAELYTYRSKVKLLHHFESLAFGGHLDGCCPRRFSEYHQIGKTCGWRGRLLESISLFPEIIKNGSLSMVFNQEVRCIDWNQPDKEFRPDACLTIGKYRIGFHIDPEVLEAAKDIANRTK